MSGKVLLGALGGAMVTALLLSAGGIVTRLEAQAPVEPPAGRVEARDALPTKIQSESDLKQLHRAHDELLRYSAQRQKAELDLTLKRAKLESIASIVITPTDLETSIKRDPEIQNLTKEIDETAEFQSGIVSSSALGKDDPDYKEAIERLHHLCIMRAKRRQEITAAAVAEFRQAHQGRLEAEIAALENEVQTLKAAEKTMQSLVDLFVEKARKSEREEKDLTPPAPKLLSLDQKLDKILDRLDKLGKRLDKLEPKKQAPK